MIKKALKKEVLRNKHIQKKDGSINLYELSKITGLHITSLNNFFYKDKDFTTKSIQKIFDALGVVDIIFVLKCDF